MLVFVTNELLSPSKREQLKLPMEFICFAIADGRMYTYYLKRGTFNVKGLRAYGNDKLYGAVYSLKDPYFHLRTLDAMHNCSKSALGRNHALDMEHRVLSKVNPILFDNLGELDRLKYRELEEISVEMYVGNLNHPKINSRIQQIEHNNFRVTNGIDAENFINQWRGINGRTSSF